MSKILYLITLPHVLLNLLVFEEYLMDCAGLKGISIIIRTLTEGTLMYRNMTASPVRGTHSPKEAPASSYAGRIIHAQNPSSWLM